MIDFREYYRSVEIVWFLWFFSMAVTSYLTIRGLAVLRSSLFRQWWACERGGAYSLNYVMVIPFYVLFVCVVIECTHILVVKTGTVYAAYVGARTACVWESSTSPAKAKLRSDYAARRAFVPFANGVGPERQSSFPTLPHHQVYYNAYKRFVEKPAPEDFVMAKYKNAERFFSTSYVHPKEWDDDIEFQVKYKFRFHLPGAAQALGVKAQDGYYYMSIESSVALQNEAPQNQEQKLGINYANPN